LLFPFKLNWPKVIGLRLTWEQIKFHKTGEDQI